MRGRWLLFGALAGLFSAGTGIQAQSKFHDNSKVVPTLRQSKKERLPFSGPAPKPKKYSVLEPKLWDGLNQRQKRKAIRNNPSLLKKFKRTR